MNCPNQDHWYNVLVFADCPTCRIGKEVREDLAIEAVMQREEKKSLQRIPCDMLLREIFIKFGDKNGNKNY